MSSHNNTSSADANGEASNVLDLSQNEFAENDDGSIIDANNNIEGECITPKDEEDSVRNSRRNRNIENVVGNRNENENKDERRGRNEPIRDSHIDAGNNSRSDAMSNGATAAGSLRNMGSGQTNDTSILGEFANTNRGTGRDYGRNEVVEEEGGLGNDARSGNRREREQEGTNLYETGSLTATTSNVEEVVGGNNSSIESVHRSSRANLNAQQQPLNQRNDADGIIVNNYDDVYDDVDVDVDVDANDAVDHEHVSNVGENLQGMNLLGSVHVAPFYNNGEPDVVGVTANDNENDKNITTALVKQDNTLNSEAHDGLNVTSLESAEALITTLQKELTCPICLDYFHLPVTMNCGHTFCRYCIGHNKLSGKSCPLCRQVLGNTLCINTIISNLVRMYNLKRKSYTIYRSIELVNTVDENWWNENFIKPQVSVSLFLRIFLNDMISPPIFFDDLTTCIIDFFTVNNLWAKAKWVFNMKDCRVFSELIGYNKDDKEATNDRLRAWVENYIIKNPSMCMRKDEKIILKLYQDRTHRIESHIFDSAVLPNRLPWDGGRHIKSLIHMPHSSVSLSHLLFVKVEKNLIGVVDCGSTIGTMVKVNNFHVLKEGDVIHIGDRLEVTVAIDHNTAGMPYKGYVWNKNANKVLDRHELNELIRSERVGNGEEGEEQSNVDEILNENDIPSYCENIECNLQIKFDLGTAKDDITPKTEYIDPKGVVLGRGPYAQSSYRKISVTNSNGYISREHCLIYYDGSKPAGERWLLRDTSTLGTFLKIKPYSNPVPLPIGSVFKAGQCKIEVCSPDMPHYAQFTERSISMHHTHNGANLDQFINHFRNDHGHGGAGGVGGAGGTGGNTGGAGGAAGGGNISGASGGYAANGNAENNNRTDVSGMNRSMGPEEMRGGNTEETQADCTFERQEQIIERRNRNGGNGSVIIGTNTVGSNLQFHQKYDHFFKKGKKVWHGNTSKDVRTKRDSEDSGSHDIMLKLFSLKSNKQYEDMLSQNSGVVTYKKCKELSTKMVVNNASLESMVVKYHNGRTLCNNKHNENSGNDFVDRKFTEFRRNGYIPCICDDEQKSEKLVFKDINKQKADRKKERNGEIIDTYLRKRGFRNTVF